MSALRIPSKEWIERAIYLATLLALAAALVFAPDAAANTTDYDTDDDNLIEISNLAQLNAMRWDLDGEGTSDYESQNDA